MGEIVGWAEAIDATGKDKKVDFDEDVIDETDLKPESSTEDDSVCDVQNSTEGAEITAPIDSDETIQDLKELPDKEYQGIELSFYGQMLVDAISSLEIVQSTVFTPITGTTKSSKGDQFDINKGARESIELLGHCAKERGISAEDVDACMYELSCKMGELDSKRAQRAQELLDKDEDVFFDQNSPELTKLMRFFVEILVGAELDNAEGSQPEE